jgi:beta-N-acetylhexosaminidase
VFQTIDPTRPATLSRPVVTGLLRNELGYTGLVFSDDLEMKAVSETFGVPQAACLAIEAGCDQVLVCEHEELTFAAHAALCERAEREPVFAARLREAAQRSLDTRRRFVRAPLTGPVDPQLMAADSAHIEQRIARALSEAAVS